MKTIRSIATAGIVAVALIVQPPLAAQAATGPGLKWSAVVERLPIGSHVKVRTRSGERLTAVLFETDATGITVKPLKRIPEPSRRIPFADLDRLESDQNGIRWGRAAAIGATIGGAVFLALLAVAANE